MLRPSADLASRQAPPARFRDASKALSSGLVRYRGRAGLGLYIFPDQSRPRSLNLVNSGMNVISTVPVDPALCFATCTSAMPRLSEDSL